MSDVDIPSVRFVSLNLPMDLTYTKIASHKLYVEKETHFKIHNNIVSISCTYKFINIVTSPTGISIAVKNSLASTKDYTRH